MLNKNESAMIFQMLAKEVGMIPTREMITVWMGMKTARLSGSGKSIKIMENASIKLGLSTVRSHKKYIGIRDVGKGGWSNKFGGEFPSSSDKGDWLLYIAKNKDLALKARLAEDEDREFDFGDELGIPSCCSKFYIEKQHEAMEKQNDYVPLVLKNSNSNGPHNYHLNYVAQYFGYSLISFFPCSFECTQAIEKAKKGFSILKDVAPDLAEETLQYLKMPILYTEYRGLYAFGDSYYEPETRVLKYSNTMIRGTLPQTSVVFSKLIKGNSLEVISNNNVRIFNDRKHISDLRGENVSICLF